VAKDYARRVRELRCAAQHPLTAELWQSASAAAAGPHHEAWMQQHEPFHIRDCR